MKVLKFGGSSLKPFEEFLTCCNLVTKQLANSNGIVVVSAFGGVTNLLQQALDSALTGIFPENEYQQIVAQHQTRLKELKEHFSGYHFDALEKQKKAHLNNLYQLLQGITLVKDANERTQAKVLAYGELLSSNYFFESVKAALVDSDISDDIEVVLIESQSFIKTQGSPLEAHYDEELTDKAMQSLSMKGQNQWAVAPGFIASNEDGDLTLLGRNGSDLSAAIFAATLKADELQIWSDVEGIYNADPNRVPQAQVVDKLSYREAMELSFFGAKVLHPKTIAPIASHKIPTLIKNTYNPDAVGTLITESNERADTAIAGITMLDNLAMLNLSGVNLKGQAGLAERVFRCISKERVSIILISQSSSEYAISICVKEADVKRATRALNNEFSLEMKHQQVDPIEVRQHLSSITVVGDHMKQTHGVAAKLFSALATANVNVVAIAQDSSERSISAIIRQAKADVALSKTYEYFFNCPRMISVILYGVGTIGSELIEQISRQQQELLKQRVDVRVVGIANSKKLLWEPLGIDLTLWNSQFEHASSSPKIEQLLTLIDQQRPLNPVFVDCSSSDELADEYVTLFQQGLHIVAANKKANTSNIDYYRALRSSAHSALKQFGYETNVGAGLPIIANIQNQVRSGDKLVEFSGILSGSLSYIMGRLEDGLSFSQAVLEAREKGFTEPDPRDDLSGMDVARKLLIIAREFGAQSELNDVAITPLLTPELIAADNIESFLEQLSEVDETYAQKVTSAKEHDQVLRFAGVIDDQNNMSVDLIAVDRSHPLHSIRDGENAFSFTTARYQPVPLVIRGYGAGAEVTAAGVFGDILQTVVA
ncbi:bifunctional aspartate kinase/homoserine dehydrogenase I [Pleionea sediminis]|uniref:bifunctional aspartate kinase/homoserine dehydrogenase I n=1 Tax=Pleionea sediminis TaxID=2569479 RepID=UPI00118598A2|nr:bifunctional aspartate kinase/homoserine dehydrogenase I [Pleionea sediminis]